MYYNRRRQGKCFRTYSSIFYAIQTLPTKKKIHNRYCLLTGKPLSGLGRKRFLQGLTVETVTDFIS